MASELAIEKRFDEILVIPGNSAFRERLAEPPGCAMVRCIPGRMPDGSRIPSPDEGNHKCSIASFAGFCKGRSPAPYP